LNSKLIDGLRSVSLNVPDLVRAEAFYTGVWHLSVAARTAQCIYLRGTGDDPYLLALHQGEKTAIRHVTLRARQAEHLLLCEQAFRAAGGTVVTTVSSLDEPGGGIGIMLRDPDGRMFQIVHSDERNTPTNNQPDSPIRLAHAVLNSRDVERSQAFLVAALDFVLIDRTKIMAFMNCNNDHHSIAFGDADNNALNHIAFLMPNLEAVMRGGGRMRDHGYPIEWGPGRHGPGDNAFNYFIGPFGEVIEYTANVEQVDDTYAIGSPSDWTWPKGRVDQWGISPPPSQRLRQAQRVVHFIPS
jgi:catechol 2,3-dioxygenase-like lactoylglutathione lyase family enzyme